MLINSILIPSMVFASPFQNLMSDLQAIRIDVRFFAVGRFRTGAVTGVIFSSVLIGHNIMRAESFGHPSWLEDVTFARPPRYIEKRLSKPYTSSLLRNRCIAQRIPAPPLPTCVNKAIKPSFEYAEKSPAQPAFPIRRQTCSLQPARVFIDSSMTFLYPPSSANILVFPEPAQPTILEFPQPVQRVDPLLPKEAALVGSNFLLATFYGLIIVWYCLIAMAESKPSVYAPMVYLLHYVSGSGSENVQGEDDVTHPQASVLGDPDQVSANDCRNLDSNEDTLVSPPSSSILSMSEAQSSPKLSLPSVSPADKHDGSVVPSAVLSLPNNGSHFNLMDEFASLDSPASPLVLPLSLESHEHEQATLVRQKNDLVAPGPPLLLHPDSTCVFGPSELSTISPEPVLPAPFVELANDATISDATATEPQPVLDPKAAIFVPRSAQPLVSVAATEPTPLLLDVTDASPTRSLRDSIHAPEFQPTNGPKACSLKVLDHAPLPILNKDFPSTSKSPSPETSIPTSSPENKIDSTSEVRSLESSMHAPAPRPIPSASGLSKPLNPAAQAFLPGAPKFFMQNYCSVATLRAPPPKKRRIRSPQMLERRRLKREAKALARATAEAEAAEAAGMEVATFSEQ